MAYEVLGCRRLSEVCKNSVYGFGTQSMERAVVFLVVPHCDVLSSVLMYDIISQCCPAYHKMSLVVIGSGSKKHPISGISFGITSGCGTVEAIESRSTVEASVRVPMGKC